MPQPALAMSTIAIAVALAACASRPVSSVPAAPRNPPQASAPTAPLEPASAAELLTTRALAMLGQPYRYGGDAPGGFDCSGLVQYAARAAGLALPRTAEEQLKIGTPVPRTSLASGDLVFLHLAGKELHVGIALDGGRFIHAPSSGGRVRIDSLAAMPYARGFIAARRIAPAPP
jgi:cell wall-associated NlpC family hydrolase